MNKQKIKMFKVLEGYDKKNLVNLPSYIPWEMLNEEQAKTNHSQTLSRLHERGGLCVTEILANIQRQSKRDWTVTQDAVDELNKLVKQFNNAPTKSLSKIPMNSKALRLGNLFKEQHTGTIIRVIELKEKEIMFSGNFEGLWQAVPMRITEDHLVKFGFFQLPHFTVGGSWQLNLSRNRQLSISSVGTPNEMLFLQEIGKDEADQDCVEDLVCIWNFDYDGWLHVHQLQNLHFVLTGEELGVTNG